LPPQREKFSPALLIVLADPARAVVDIGLIASERPLEIRGFDAAVINARIPLSRNPVFNDEFEIVHHPAAPN
jgi:hypothetical protein